MSKAGVQILDPETGRPVSQARRNAAYDAASFDGDVLSAWRPRYASADADLNPERPLIVARGRDLNRNSAWIAGAAQSQIDSHVGRGLRLISRPDHEALGQPAEWAIEIGRQIETRWKQYADDLRFGCDVHEQRDFAGMCALAHWQWYLGGELVGKFDFVEAPGRQWGTAFEFIDGDRLSNPNNNLDTQRMRNGVELGERGQPVAYHFRKTHPGDFELGTFGAGSGEWVRVPRATSFGRPVVLHSFRADRPGQSRGKPPIASIVESLQLLKKYSRAQAESAVVRSLYAAVLKSPFDPAITAEAMGSLDGGAPFEDVLPYQALRADYNAKNRIKLNGVRVPQLAPGEDLDLKTAAGADENFSDFVATFHRELAAATGSSYEQVSRDYSKTNYSSARAALLEAWKYLNGLGGFIERHYASQHYSNWLEEDLDSGFYDLPAGIPAFEVARTAWSACRWLAAPRGWIDPVKEAQAAALRIKHNLSTYEQECAAQGHFWQEVFMQRRVEEDFAAEQGLRLNGDDTSLPSVESAASVAARGD